MKHAVPTSHAYASTCLALACKLWPSAVLKHVNKVCRELKSMSPMDSLSLGFL